MKKYFVLNLEIPKDQGARDYICHLADKIREQTSGHKYQGNLTNDAQRLGIRTDHLKEIVNLNHGITSIARELFKRIIPEQQRSANNWNKLSEDVFLKEKILIGTYNDNLYVVHLDNTVAFIHLDFLVRYK